MQSQWAVYPRRVCVSHLGAVRFIGYSVLTLKHVRVTIVFGLFRRSDDAADMGCGVPCDILSGGPGDCG